MRPNPVFVAVMGVALLAIGATLALYSGRRYAERRVIANAGTCRLEMNIVQLAGLPENSQSGTVILFHGLAANNVIMSYLARALAEQGLRVYVPDLPGHGRSAGPFTPAEAEACGQSFVRGLAARGYINPERTILAGHSMGAAIALRVAAKIRVAGVVAISPAPMKTAHGVTSEALLYQNPPSVPPDTLIVAGGLEPSGLRDNAADLAASNTDGTTKFVLLPYQTHVSVLFSSSVARLEQGWAAQVLHLPASPRLPFRGNLFGGLFGLLGILVLAGPFLREAVGQQPVEETSTAKPVPVWRLFVEFGLVSFAVVVLLQYWMPLRLLHLFEGDYLASFFFLTGFVLLSLHLKAAQKSFLAKRALVLGAGSAALVLHLLVTGWMQLTTTGSWLTFERWTKFPLLFMPSFLFLYGLEVALGPVLEGAAASRLFLSLGLLSVAWGALAFGVLVLHSGEILLVLMIPYFLLFFLLSRIGAQLVRRQSGSAMAATLFSAILLAGFCLVLFPVS